MPKEGSLLLWLAWGSAPFWLAFLWGGLRVSPLRAAWGAIVGACLLLLALVWERGGVPFWQAWQASWEEQLGLLLQLAPDLWKPFDSPEVWRQKMREQLPFGLGSVFLSILMGELTLCFWLLSVCFPQWWGHRGFALERWKVPEGWVWPTLGCGFAFLLALPPKVEGVLSVCLTVLMMGYLLQACSILSFFFQTFQVKRGTRWLAYAFLIGMLTPLLLGLGFLDWWLDVRSWIAKSRKKGTS